MKKKLLILLAIICLVITGCGNKSTSNNESNNNNNNNTNNNNNENGTIYDIEFSKEQTEIEPDSYMDDLFSKLNEYGESIFRGDKYTKYSKRNGIYFASLNDIKDEYDISIFVGEDKTVCDRVNSGIYFDIDKKLGIEYGTRNPITVVLIGCSKEELNNKKAIK